MPVIFIKSLRTKPLNVKGYRVHMLLALVLEGKQIRALYAKTTSTWKPPARFRTDISVGREARVQVTTKDNRFINVDKGTRIRWAVMSNPYKTKSRVRVIGSRQGSGETVIRGKRAMMARNIRPRPGIKAREFSVEIRKRRRKPFFTNMRRAMRRAAKGTF